MLVVRRSTTSDTHSLVRARSTRSSWTEMDGAMLLIVPSNEAGLPASRPMVILKGLDLAI